MFETYVDSRRGAYPKLRGLCHVNHVLVLVVLRSHIEAEQVVLAAVQHTGMALYYASPALRDDLEARTRGRGRNVASMWHTAQHSECQVSTSGRTSTTPTTQNRPRGQNKPWTRSVAEAQHSTRISQRQTSANALKSPKMV